MNIQPSTLEKNYLANVMLFMDSVETVCTFILVNRKCADVCNYLRVNPPLKRKSGLGDTFNSRLTKLTFALFPHIQTIQGTISELEEYSYLLDPIENIILLDMPEEMYRLFPFKNKIVEVNGRVFSDKVDFSTFPKLKKVCLEMCSFALHFPNKLQKLDLLHIKQHSCCQELYVLEKYEFVDHIILEIPETTPQDVVDRLASFATLATTTWHPKLDFRIVVLHKNDISFVPSQEITSNALYILNKRNYTIGMSVNCTETDTGNVNVNLSDCTQLNELKIVYDNVHKTTVVFPVPSNNTTSLGKLCLVAKEKKVFNPNFVTKLALCLTKDVCASLTELSLKKCSTDILSALINLKRLRLDTIQFSSNISPFTTISYLSLERCRMAQNGFKAFYPSSLKKLEVFNCDEHIIKHINDLSGSTLLDTLSVSGRSNESKKIDLERFGGIHSLYILQTTFKKYPIHLNHLKIGCFDNCKLDFKSLRKIETLLVSKCFNISLSLNPNIQQLIFEGCQPLILNLNQLEGVKSVKINSTAKINFDFIPKTITSLFVLPSTNIDFNRLKRFPFLNPVNIN
ncbi:hypothetical protein EIN_484770 [Entamoeba invadens IP1]|uniref:Leucine-rich repeat containing protein n=1 Tax=Entamoeba invadens IP1 TaxID=370355 RepID=A0A0A1U7S1_ENTIV|nr:hypothetical protein EIN_484770 [Entamoeba invadens IP1]ELP89135.1 hypothetical protein EIN_484770 [Entamoeba invadens IP1]|eukprot:XP_004255906.1 hypothetical protein EIN_484770 [Entamoeba invadens IP1]